MKKFVRIATVCAGVLIAGTLCVAVVETAHDSRCAELKEEFAIMRGAYERSGAADADFVMRATKLRNELKELCGGAD